MSKRPEGEKPKKKINIGTMDIILVIIAVALLAFTIEMIQLYKETCMIPDTLVTCVFASLGGECGAMAWIKTTKERNRERQWEEADREHNESREDEQQKKQEVLNAERNNERGKDMELPQG
ncbi:MAG: hypothetical protein LUD19_03365 [Clostridia bacterium]|nr:hypothetical protein [Clostridia bacterium]